MQNLCGFAFFFFLAEGLFFCNVMVWGGGKRYSAHFQTSSNTPNWCQRFFFFFNLWHLFFKHLLPSRVLCWSLGVKYRDAKSNCGFPEGAETFKMRMGSRSVSWKCQLSPSEEANASGTSWITLPRPYTRDSQILPEGGEKRGSNAIYHPCLSAALAESSNICGTAEKLPSTLARKVMQR